MRERATRKPSASPYPRRHSISSEAAPGVPLSPGPTGQLLPSLHPGQGGEQQLSLPPGQGGEQQEAGLHIAEPNLQALQRQLQGISRLGPQISQQEESDNEEEDQFHSGGEHTDQECSEQEISDQETPDQENAEQENPIEDSQHADPMAAALKNKLAALTTDINVKRNTAKTFIDRTPQNAGTKRQSKVHLEQLLRMSEEAKKMTAQYLDKVSAADKQAEQTRLTSFLQELDVANSEVQEDFQTNIDGDEDYRLTQNPRGSAMYKAFAKKVTSIEAQLLKLKTDMEQETTELTQVRAQLYVNSLDRIRLTVEKDMAKACTEVKETHEDLNAVELDKLHSYDIDLQDQLQQLTNQLARLSLPPSVSLPATSTPNSSFIVGAPQPLGSTAGTIPVLHQPIAGAASLPPPGLGTAMSRPQGNGRNPFYKPYKDHDFPTFKGTVEEYGGGKGSGRTTSFPGWTLMWPLGR